MSSPLGCCLACQRPHQSKNEWLTEKALIAAVLCEYDESRDGVFKSLAAARAAWGRLQRAIDAYRLAHGADL